MWLGRPHVYYAIVGQGTLVLDTPVVGGEAVDGQGTIISQGSAEIDLYVRAIGGMGTDNRRIRRTGWNMHFIRTGRNSVRPIAGRIPVAADSAHPGVGQRPQGG